MGIGVSYSFTRPANTTAYAAGDLVANNTTAGSVAPMRWTFPKGGSLVRAILRTTNATIALGNFNIWLLDASPTVTNGDNGALAGVTMSTIISVVPIDLYASMGGAGGWGEAFYNAGEIPCGGTIYGLLEARGAYVPASGEIFTVTLQPAS